MFKIKFIYTPKVRFFPFYIRTATPRKMLEQLGVACPKRDMAI